MKINHHTILTEHNDIQLHFFINIPFSDCVKYEDKVFEKAVEEFKKYTEMLQKNKWYGIDTPPVECKECLSKSQAMIVESEKYVKE